MGAGPSQPSAAPPPPPRSRAGNDEVQGFSADTKAVFKLSIPFQMKFGVHGRRYYQSFTVDTITLYHPCPLRLEGIQPDAVLSLNDPSFGDPSYVILIPLVGRNVQSPSRSFIEKIASQVVAVSSPDPSTGKYLERDIPTGADWSLQKLFTTEQAGAELEVTNGYYQWEGMPPLRRVKTQNGSTLTYSWEKDPGAFTPTYIMLDTPVACNPVDIATLTQRMPVTPPSDAIHAVLYNGSDPLNRGIVHKQGTCGVGRERFTTQDIASIYSTGMPKKVVGESCDPWTAWAQTTEIPADFNSILFNILTGLAMIVGAYLALSAILRLYDQEVKRLSEGVGTVTGAFFKNLTQRARSASQAFTQLQSSPLEFTSVNPMLQTRS